MFGTRQRWAGILATLLLGSLSACRQKESFPALGTRVANPTDVGVSANGQVFYVLNSDFDRVYNQGSLLMLDPNGNKLGAVPLPRLGRALATAGSALLVMSGKDKPTDTANSDTNADGGTVSLFDVSTPQSPKLEKTFDIPCMPISGEMEVDPSTGSLYPYFAVSCMGGGLLIGHRDATNPANSTLKFVRNFGVTRRAMHIDPKRNLLFAFVTAMTEPTLSDFLTSDAGTYDDQGNQTAATPDEVPDTYQDNKADIAKSVTQRQAYQFVVYDIGTEAKAAPEPFPYRDLNDSVVNKELRWLYFTLNDYNGTPDADAGITNLQTKFYRTNFWATHPDPQNPDAFYISHRGFWKNAPLPFRSNDVIRVTITGDVAAEGQAQAPVTSNVLSFERVYGFNGGELNNGQYPGDFAVQMVNNEPLVVVNHFRDLIYFQKDDVYYSLAAQTLGNSPWFSELAADNNGQDSQNSFYQVALNNQGRLLTTSFYGNAVILLDVTPGVGITERMRIE